MNYDLNLAKTRKREQEKQFKLGKENTLFSAEIAKTPGKTYSNRLDIYSKKEIKISSEEAVHIIDKNGKFKSLTCHVTQSSIEKLKRFGLIHSETPISQAICKLGKYRQIILKRAYEKHWVTSLYREKSSLLDFSQDLLTILEPLERDTNTLDEYQYENQKISIQSKIKNTILELSKHKARQRDKLAALCVFDRDAPDKIEKLYTALVKNLNELSVNIEHASFEEFKVLLRPTGPNAILTHVKNMGMAIIVKTQELNQNLTYSRKAKSFFRGELHNACEDALQVIQNYEADPYNPILPEHQGNFNGCTSTIAIDFSRCDGKK